MRRIVLAGFLALAACGAEGPPVAPSGATVTGEGRVGVVIGG